MRGSHCPHPESETGHVDGRGVGMYKLDRGQGTQMDGEVVCIDWTGVIIGCLTGGHLWAFYGRHISK